MYDYYVAEYVSSYTVTRGYLVDYWGLVGGRSKEWVVVDRGGKELE